MASLKSNILLALLIAALHAEAVTDDVAQPIEHRGRSFDMKITPSQERNEELSLILTSPRTAISRETAAFRSRLIF